MNTNNNSINGNDKFTRFGQVNITAKTKPSKSKLALGLSKHIKKTPIKK